MPVRVGVGTTGRVERILVAVQGGGRVARRGITTPAGGKLPHQRRLPCCSLMVPELKMPGTGEVVLPQLTFQVGGWAVREALHPRAHVPGYWQGSVTVLPCPALCVNLPVSPLYAVLMHARVQAVGRGRNDAEQHCARQALEQAHQAGLKAP